MHVEQDFGRDDESGGADAALQGSLVQEGLLQWMQRFAMRNAFNCDDGTALRFCSEHEARRHETMRSGRA